MNRHQHLQELCCSFVRYFSLSFVHLGNLGAICLGTLYTVSALGNVIVPVILYLSGSVKGCLIVSSFVMV